MLLSTSPYQWLAKLNSPLSAEQKEAACGWPFLCMLSAGLRLFIVYCARTVQFKTKNSHGRLEKQKPEKSKGNVMSKKVIKGICLTCALLSSNLHADDSPLSPAFVLKDKQLLSATSVGYSKINFDPYMSIIGTGLFKGSGEAHGVFASQTLRFGLADGTELAVSVDYDDFDQHGSRIVQIADGFSSPTFGARHTWGKDTAVRLAIWGEATPKTADHGVRGLPAVYALGGTGTFITENGLVTQLQAARTLVDGDQANSTVFGIAAYKELGLYSLGANLAVRSYASANTLQFDSKTTLGFRLGRKLCDSMWAQIAYVYTDSSFQELRLSELVRIGVSSYETNTISASLNVLF